MITGDHFGNEINVTMEAVGKWIPDGCGIHILPPFNSAGDYGFAPNSILEIDRAFGTWHDLKALSTKYKIILDGIFNHIGVHSRIFPDPVTHNNSTGMGRDYFFVFPKADTDQALNLSTRGGSVFRRSFMLDDVEYSVWQTFSAASIDFNLDNEKVQNYINDFINLCVSNRIWGIRLDAVAYYSKELGVTQLHHPKAKKYARAIADKLIDRGMFVLAQLDSDPRGQAYFPSYMGYNIPVCDYAFTAYLLYTQLSGNAEPLERYLVETEKCAHMLLRSPRNHDGILLRPKMFDVETKKKLLQLCELYNIPVRISNGTPYEINNSYPYLCKICSASKSEAVFRNHASIILTALQNGVPYLYFPELVGYMSELEADADDEEDPRGLNRVPIDEDYLKNVINEPANQKLIEILAFITKRLGDTKLKIQKTRLIDTSCLVFELVDAQISLVINFSHEKAYVLDSVIDEGDKCIYSSTDDATMLEAGGYAIIDNRGKKNDFRKISS